MSDALIPADEEAWACEFLGNWADGVDIDDESMVDLGGGMIVPLRELLEES